MKFINLSKLSKFCLDPLVLLPAALAVLTLGFWLEVEAIRYLGRSPTGFSPLDAGLAGASALALLGILHMARLPGTKGRPAAEAKPSAAPEILPQDVRTGPRTSLVARLTALMPRRTTAPKAPATGGLRAAFGRVAPRPKTDQRWIERTERLRKEAARRRTAA